MSTLQLEPYPVPMGLSKRNLVPLGHSLHGLRRSFAPQDLPLSPIPTSPKSIRLVPSKSITAYDIDLGHGWVEYSALRDSMLVRHSGTNVTALDADYVFAPAKLIVPDSTTRLRSVVCWERVYPRRAWVGLPNEECGLAGLFVVAGILNGPLGPILWKRETREFEYVGKDIVKKRLERLPVPTREANPEAYDNAATLSYRLHCIRLAQRDLPLPARIDDEDIPNHEFRLYSELANLYQLDETEAHEITDYFARRSVGVGVRGNLFHEGVREPLSPIALIEPSDSRERRHKLWLWERRINGGIPSALRPKPWPGVADERDATMKALRYLADHRGPNYGVADTRPDSSESRLWVVDVYRVPKGNRNLSDVRSKSNPAGQVWVDGLTGKVFERREDANAFAAGA